MNTWWGPVNTVMNPWGHRTGGNFLAGLRTVGFSRMALVLISVRVRVDLRGIVRPKLLS
jgi:hypothetical protein